ncbi:hypothetical protein CENSYa_0047 [Cenarchaeum symbiosum A]|uniref:Uncharacterized protein n=1 Tax=Cenarchaeum symbiosum (strain A) TaxID=414004 RepID=A0RTM9_CENSY|nr:hypothetical protein CENSYa_0047 [Cenarchaeum symbiosum A]
MKGLIFAAVLLITVHAAWGELPILTQEEVDAAMGHKFWLVAWSGNGTLHDSQEVDDSSGIILRDKTRIFEPIYYKYKIPTVIVDAYKFHNSTGANSFWSTSSGEPVFGLMPFRGSSAQTGDCFFASNIEGAVTSCRMDDIIVRAAIHDKYHEHYTYTENMTISADEPTVIMANEMISRISGEQVKVHEVIRPARVESLQPSPADDSAAAGRPGQGVVPLGEDQLDSSPPNHTLEYSCGRDDFGLVTLDGLYINDDTFRGSVPLTVILYDGETALLSDTEEIPHVGISESREFRVHARWDGGFTHCEAHAWIQ